MASVLRDELRLEEGSDKFNAAIQAYVSALNELTDALNVVNFRIYCCRRLGIRLLAATPEVRKFAQINVARVTTTINDQVLAEELPTATKFPDVALDTLKNDFKELDPHLRHRGKFLFQFLISWMERLAEEARNPSGEVFKEKLNIKFSSTTLTLRSLASRSEMPAGFQAFVAQMVTI